LREDQYTFMIISRSVLLIIKNILVTFIQKVKAHFIFNNFFFENRAFHVIMLKHFDTDDNMADAHFVLDAQG
jgi:hypothetical protein